MIEQVQRAMSVTFPVDLEQRVGWILVHSLWQFTLIACLVWSAERLFPRASSSTRYFFFLAALLAIVVAPLTTGLAMPTAAMPSAVSLVQQPIDFTSADTMQDPAMESARVTSRQALLGPATTTRVTQADPVERPLTKSSTARQVSWLHCISNIFEPWLSTLVVIWCVGVALFSLRPIFGGINVLRLQRCGTSMLAADLQGIFDRIRLRLGVRQRVEVLTSTLVTMPMVVGCFRSIVLIPASFVSSVPTSQLEAILAHELAHVRRYDYLVNLLQTIIEAVFFYHPAVWWLSNRIRVEREHCCDDLVVSVLRNRVEYGRALLAVEEFRSLTAPSLAMRANGSSLLRRVRRLSPHAQDMDQSSATVTTIGLWLIITVVACVGLTLTAMTAVVQANAEETLYRFGDESNGLRLRLIPLSSNVDDNAPALADTQSKWRQPSQLTFGIELKNVSNKPLTLAGIRYGDGYSESVQGKLRAELWAPHWFDFYFTDQDGVPVQRPEREFYQAWLVADGSSTHVLAPGESLIEVLRPAQFHAPMDFQLSPGKYKVHVRYHGPDDTLREQVRKHWPDRPILGAWRHSVESNAVAFEVKEMERETIPKTLNWGKPKNGLRAAIEYRLPKDKSGNPSIAPGVPVGTSIGVVFHLENVSDLPITFVSETGRQGDQAHVTDEQGKSISIEQAWFSGEPIDVAWRLMPGEVAELHLLSPGLGTIKDPGKYSVRYTVRFNSRLEKDDSGNVIFPRPGDYDQELDTGDTPLYLTDESNLEAQGSQQPFRLPDHWIIEDLRWVNNDREILTVALQGGVDVRRWDVASRALLSEIKLKSDVHGRPIRQGSLRISADGRRVIGVTDAYVGIWDTSTGQLLRQLDIPQRDWSYDTVGTLACSPDGGIIVAGLETTFLRTTLMYPSYGIVWNSTTGEVISRFEQAGGYELVDIAIAEDGRSFVTCSRGQQVIRWDTATGRLLEDFSDFARQWTSPAPELIKNNMISGIDITRDGRMIAIAGTFGVRLIDIGSKTLIRTIALPFRYNAADITFSEDGERFVWFGAKTGDGIPESVTVWSTQTGDRLYELETEASIARMGNETEQVAVGESDFYEAISVWPLGTDHQLGPVPPQPYERTNRVEENTHLVGEEAREYAERWKPAWGPAQGGVEYGIAVTEDDRAFKIGERVPLVTFIRNVSPNPLHIAVKPDMFGNAPRITTESGDTPKIDTHSLVGSPSHYRETLQPGECFGPLYLSVGLGSEQFSKPGSWVPYWNSPVGGQHTLVHEVKIYIAPADSDRNASTESDHWKAGQLTSGKTSFSVVN